MCPGTCLSPLAVRACRFCARTTLQVTPSEEAPFELTVDARKMGLESSLEQSLHIDRCVCLCRTPVRGEDARRQDLANTQETVWHSSASLHVQFVVSRAHPEVDACCGPVWRCAGEQVLTPRTRSCARRRVLATRPRNGQARTPPPPPNVIDSRFEMPDPTIRVGVAVVDAALGAILCAGLAHTRALALPLPAEFGLAERRYPNHKGIEKGTQHVDGQRGLGWDRRLVWPIRGPMHEFARHEGRVVTMPPSLRQQWVRVEVWVGRVDVASMEIGNLRRRAEKTWIQ